MPYPFIVEMTLEQRGEIKGPEGMHGKKTIMTICPENSLVSDISPEIHLDFLNEKGDFRHMESAPLKALTGQGSFTHREEGGIS